MRFIKNIYMNKIYYQDSNYIESTGYSISFYSKSLRFGFFAGSLESKPKINNETKKIIEA